MIALVTDEYPTLTNQTVSAIKKAEATLPRLCLNCRGEEPLVTDQFRQSAQTLSTAHRCSSREELATLDKHDSRQM